MKTACILLSFFALLAPSVAFGCPCGTTTAAATPAANDAAERHPLKGLVVNVEMERTALLVKHEDVPGVMKAMTMMLKVDATTLASVKKGDAVTGLLVNKSGAWWLEEVKAVVVTE